MTFADLFSDGAILNDLRAETSDACFQEILGRLVSQKRLTVNDSALALDALRARERISSTAIGNGVAIPHAKLEKIGSITVAFGYHKNGLDFRSIDGDKVQIIFLVIRPVDDFAEHLKLLQWISRLGRNPGFRRSVSGASGPDEILRLLRDLESVGLRSA